MLFVFLFGGNIVFYVPTIVVGALIFHLSIELVKEAFYDPLFRGISKLEYGTIMSIALAMIFIGFTEVFAKPQSEYLTYRV